MTAVSSAGMSTSTITMFAQRPRRNVELALVIGAVAIVVLAYLSVGLGSTGQVPLDIVTQGAWLLGLTLAFHAVLRWRATYADPLILPIVTLLNGLGLVMIHRLDLDGPAREASAPRQIMWSALAMMVAAAVLVFLRDHRILRRYTFTCAAVGLLFMLLPLAPLIGRADYGARIWIKIGSFSFQPGEVAKILLTVFFAGYLVQTRDALSLAGRTIPFIRLQLPRGRDLGPILIAWLASLAVLVLERDLGSSLLFFGLFVAMLYVATERRSWIAIGLSLFGAGAYLAFLLFDHVQVRVNTWLDLWNQAFDGTGYQLRQALMGLGAGGMLGTGLGQGHPSIVPLAESDFIIASLAEELGLTGLFAILVLYALLVERGLRTALGTRDGFGKLLAAGLAFSLAMQVFVIVGGVLRVIPLTGLTTPFLSAGGSSLLANWTIVALLLRISDHARRPLPDPTGSPEAPADLPILPDPDPVASERAEPPVAPVPPERADTGPGSGPGSSSGPGPAPAPGGTS